MQKRSIAGVLVLSVVTCGIYYVYWLVKTKREMVEHGADIPTSWLMLVPFASFYWSWKWSGGVDYLTRGRMTQPVAFIVMQFLPLIGMAIMQDALNTAIDQGLPNQTPSLPMARIA